MDFLGFLYGLYCCTRSPNIVSRECIFPHYVTLGERECNLPLVRPNGQRELILREGDIPLNVCLTTFICKHFTRNTFALVY